MKTLVSVRVALAVSTGALFFLVQSQPADADHIPKGTDVNILRPPMPFEGYLNFRISTAPGEERTGWTDSRHPALDGTVDNRRGYDFSDNQVVVLTHNVRVDPPPGPAGDSLVTPPLRRQDFDVTNAAYAQAGIGVRQEDNHTILGNDIVANAGGDVEPSLSMLFGNDRSANARTVNQYYVDNIPAAEGYALMPNYAANGGAAGPPNVYNNGFAVPDTTRSIANPNPPPAILPNSGSATFAHELGHFLLDENRFTTGDTFHSSRADDLMLPSPLDPDPAAHKIQAEMFGLREPGQQVGNIGTHNHLGENVTTNLGTGVAITQTRAMHRSPFVQEDDNAATHGDRADFDWVEDNLELEFAGGEADNHPGIRDFIIWEIGAVGSDHVHNGRDTNFAHIHDAWGELNLGAFIDPFFRTIDIVSQIARYADMDVDPTTKQWSARESALDFGGGGALFPEFSFDGINWMQGSLVNVFIPGWHPNLDVRPEDFVSRWRSPIDARFVRLAAAALGGNHDGNTQIDAIIASREVVATIPEPSSLALFGAGAVGLLSYTWRRRWPAHPTLFARRTKRLPRRNW